MPHVDVLDSKYTTLPAHPSVPAPPPKATKTLLMVLVLSSDPLTAQPADVPGGVKAVQGIRQGVKTVRGCPPQVLYYAGI